MTILHLTKKQIRQYIKEELFGANGEGDGGSSTEMTFSHDSPEGDTGMTPEVHKFLYVGQPTEEMQITIKGIISTLEDGGIKFSEDTGSIVKRILQDIHKIVRETSTNLDG